MNPRIVPLHLDGLRAGTGKLTWGQLFVWDIMRSLPADAAYLNVPLLVDVPDGTTLGHVLAALRAVVQRHDVLHTTFHNGPDATPTQRVEPEGTLCIEVHDIDDQHAARTARDRLDAMWSVTFDEANAWPVRVAVVLVDGSPRHVLFVFSHLAVDAWGCHLLHDRFLRELRTGTGAEEPASDAWQPLDRAAYESTEPGREISARSAGYWHRTLTGGPVPASALVRHAPEQPRFPGHQLRSSALAAAAHILASRCRVSETSVVIAAAATMLRQLLDVPAICLFLAAGNRFTARDRASVGTFYQGAPVVIPVDDSSFAATIRAAHAQATLAYARGQGDPRQLGDLVTSVGAARGLDLRQTSTINVVPQYGAQAVPVPPAADLQQLVSRTRLTTLPGRHTEQLTFYLHVKALHRRAVLELLTDSRLLDSADSVAVLLGMERITVAAAGCADLDQRDIAGIAAQAGNVMPTVIPRR